MPSFNRKTIPSFFIDWVSLYQDFDFELPMVSDHHYLVVDSLTGEQLHTKTPPVLHEGSYCTKISIKVSGCRLYMSGNPSRFDRLDNLFGFSSIDDCVAVFNRVLLSLGLPPFTKCTRVWHTQAGEGSKAQALSDGAVITRLDITGNRSVGVGNVTDYIRGLSTQRYRHSIPHLFTNGRTCGWFTKKGLGDEGKLKARMLYPSVYDKAYELELHLLPKIERKYGKQSTEARYVKQVITYCRDEGIARFEQKLHSEWLTRHGCKFWGLFDLRELEQVHNEFLSIDERLQVTAMDFETISERLLREGLVTNVKAANATCMYALQWAHGQKFDFNKSQVKTHRARLRRIGIDIAEPFVAEKHCIVQVRRSVEIEVRETTVPHWYHSPRVGGLRLVA